MEQARAYTSSTEQIDLPNMRNRSVPDVPEDVDFMMEHLNDPNYDLRKTRPPSFESVENGEKGEKKLYDTDGESHYDSDRYSTSRAESRNSTAVDFDE